uniref:Glycine N-acyltransferase-like protein n=1 Tax=Panagrellus redivivus TaxID=6233 RepID=A0A7E4VXT4_PANRE
MLTFCKTADTINSALAHFSAIPDFTLPTTAAKIYLLGKCAETVEFKVFSFKCPVTGFESFAVLRMFKPNPSRSYLVFGAATNAKFADETIKQVFDELAELVPEFFTSGTMTLGTEVLAPQINKCLSEKFPDFDFIPYPTQMYYMTKSQQTVFMDSIKDGIKLPDGYVFDKANFDTDLETILDTWLHKAPGEEPYLRTKLSHLPNSLIRHIPTGDAASCEHIDAVGLMTHQFTIKEHRQKGLGTAVEKDMCRQLISLGLTPFKCVELYNVNLLKASDNTVYWTRRDCDIGKPSVTTYLEIISKKTDN